MPDLTQEREAEERKRFEHWYACNAFDYARNPIGSRECGLQWAAWRAALAAEREPLTDEQIQAVVTESVRSGRLSWVGFKRGDEGKYTVPALSHADYEFARAIEAAHGIKPLNAKLKGGQT